MGRRTLLPTRIPYDIDADEAADDATKTVNTEPSQTMQSFAKDADLNEIVRRMGVEDHPMPAPVDDPRYYGDMSEAPDLRTLLDRGRDAAERFQALPASLRAEFDNQPDKFYKYVADPANFDNAVKRGFLAVPEDRRRPVNPRRRKADIEEDDARLRADLAELKRRREDDKA